MKTLKLEVRQQFNNDGQLVREEYWLDGKRHNSAGPAVRRWYYNGQVVHETFWLNGKTLLKEEWQLRTRSCSGKIIEFEGKKYKLVEVSE